MLPLLFGQILEFTISYYHTETSVGQITCSSIVLVVQLGNFVIRIYVYLKERKRRDVALNTAKPLIFGGDLNWLIWLEPKNRQIK